MMPTHPDELTGDQLVARVQGDALQLAGLVHDHGPETFGHILDMWGAAHTRRVAIALAAAINPDMPVQDLWAWLGYPIATTTTSVHLSELWRQRDPHIGDDRHNNRPRRISEEGRARMAERARNLNRRSA